MYGAHWLEMFAVNPALRGDPDAIQPGHLINVGVSLRVVRAQTLDVLVRRLHTTVHALRLLNPDIPNDDWPLKPFDRQINISDTPGYASDNTFKPTYHVIFCEYHRHDTDVIQ
jgi:hypothetical protein